MYVKAFYQHQESLKRVYEWMQNHILVENDDVQNYMAIMYRMRQNTEKALEHYNLIIDESKIDKELENYCRRLGYPFKENDAIDKILNEVEEAILQQIQYRLLITFPTDQPGQQIVDGQFANKGTSSQWIQQTGNHQNIANNEGILRNMASLNAQQLGESSSHQMEEMAPNQFPFYDEGNHPIVQFQTQLQRSTLSHQTQTQDFDYMQFLSADDDQIQERLENAHDQVNIPAEINESNGNETSNRSERMRGRITAGNIEQQIGDGHGRGQEATQ